jgi:hypothetical protein
MIPTVLSSALALHCGDASREGAAQSREIVATNAERANDDHHRKFWINVPFAADFVTALQTTAGGKIDPSRFDPTQHCLQALYDEDDPVTTWYELSASGPCPSDRPVKRARIVTTFGSDSRYFLTPPSAAGPGHRVGQFTEQIVDGREGAELAKLCFGTSDWPDFQGFRDDYGAACELVLKGGRVCEIVLAGASPARPECM